jgi:hypothetical protein
MFDHAQIGPEVTARTRYRLDQRAPDLSGKALELLSSHGSKLRTTDRLE